MGMFNDYLCLETKEKVYANLFAEKLKQGFESCPEYKTMFGGTEKKGDKIEILEKEGGIRLIVAVDDIFGGAGCSLEKVNDMESLIKEFIEQNSSAKITVSYNVECYMDGDNACAYFDYEGSTLKAKKVFYSEGTPTYCEACDAEFEDYADDIEDACEFDFDKEYVCPECGEQLFCDCYGETYKMKLTNGKWSIVEKKEYEADSEDWDDECIFDEEGTEERLDGLTFVITGKLSYFENREEITEYIEENGGKVVGSISKNTNYLINNDSKSTSSKNKKAQELCIPVITEKEFIEAFCDMDEFED